MVIWTVLKIRITYFEVDISNKKVLKYLSTFLFDISTSKYVILIFNTVQITIENFFMVAVNEILSVFRFFVWQ